MPVSVSDTKLLLGNAEEFGVWPWSGSLCANHHFKFLRLRAGGKVHISIKTLQPYQGYISKKNQTNTGTHIMLFFNYKKEKKKKIHFIKKTNDGKIAFFGQGQPVHFWLLALLFIHIISFCPHTSPFFHNMIVKIFFFFGGFKVQFSQAHASLSTRQSCFCCLITLLELNKTDSKVQVPPAFLLIHRLEYSMALSLVILFMLFFFVGGHVQKNRGKHRSAASLYSGVGFSLRHGCAWVSP